ncbi:MAG TPA: terminase family protein [Allosphingosinicella sp.]|jgi:phage terminase large subunit-like protein
MNVRSSNYVGGDAVAADPDDFGPWLEALARIKDPDELAYRVAQLSGPAQRRLLDAWDWQRHRGQEEPEGDWRVWLARAGRGFGKTKLGAEWVWQRVRETGSEARIALVGGTIDEVVQVMVEGKSGLARAARTGEYARWVGTRRCVEFSNGALGFAYSGERPEKLRGPEHHFAWCDELAKWSRGEAAWDNLQMTMRLGTRPRILVTTTPKPTPLMRRIEGEAKVTRGRMANNKALPQVEVEALAAMYGGTRLGRQELDGELIEEVEGALFKRKMLERARHSGPAPREWMARVVVGVDPPASAEGDACGIVVCGLGADGAAYVLADCSAPGLAPEGWARKVAAAAEAWGADRVVAEANNGGEMVRAVLRAAEAGLPVKLVHASRGKAARAEPVAVLFEDGRARLAGRFPELEDELAGIKAAGGYEGPGRSPDRADAMVWALSELMLQPARAAPRVRRL